MKCERRKIMTETNRKKQLLVDLAIIGLTMGLAFLILILVGNKMNSFTYNRSVNIVLRVAAVGFGAQFVMAGLGICIVCLIRKEAFSRFGLTRKKLVPAVFLSLACCIPSLLYQIFIGSFDGWCPMWQVNTTPEVLTSGFPENVIAFMITVVCWGFFEAFNYVVIQDKISELCPSKLRFWDMGACICAVMCILVHGMVGVTPDSLIQMVTTLIIIYGMLIVKKETGNAWGCVAVFVLYWNAVM